MQLAIVAFVATSITAAARGDLYINEIFFDPPGSGDNSQEYIELRGTPNMSLDNHYLVLLEMKMTRPIRATRARSTSSSISTAGRSAQAASSRCGSGVVRT